MTPLASAEGSLESLVAATAEAVIATQTKLDSVSTEGDGIALAIPRAAASVEFGLERRGGYRFLFGLSEKTRREKHTHRLELSLISTPEPPGDPVAKDPVQHLNLLEPAFMLAPAREKRLYDLLLEVLESTSSPRRWRFVSPEGGKQPKPGDLQKEAGLIRTARRSPTGDLGLVAFRLGDGRYLVARIAGKVKRDSLFEINEGAAEEVLIYSYRGDGVGPVVYRPLHQLALSIRTWLGSRATGPETRLDLVRPGGGWNAVRDISKRLWNAYRSLDLVLTTHASRYLEERAFRPLGYVLPPFFALEELRVELGYSVSYETKKASHRFSFVNRRPFLESRVVIRPRRAASELDIRLVAPGFVLVDDARTALVELAVAHSETLAEALADGGAAPAAEYLRCLKSPVYRLGVVAMLSFEDNAPTEEFLLVWPGSWAGQARDFVFTCKRTPQGLSLDKVVLRLEQSSADSSLANPYQDLDALSLAENEYKAFHNFFHAVRIWRNRILETPVA